MTPEELRMGLKTRGDHMPPDRLIWDFYKWFPAEYGCGADFNTNLDSSIGDELLLLFWAQFQIERES